MTKKTETAAATDETVQAEVATENAVTTQETQRDDADGKEEPAGESTGIRARRAFMLKQFIPNPDWINVNVVAKGKGFQTTVGRIFGMATGYEDKANTLPDGSVSASIFVKGVFQSEGFVTGEVSESSGVYFPMAYAEKIKAVLSADNTIKMLEVDCDIGLEATGKTIPYEWVVTAYVEGEEMAVLKRLRNARARPANAFALPAPDAKPSLTDQSGGATT